MKNVANLTFLLLRFIAEERQAGSMSSEEYEKYATKILRAGGNK
jgi:hypothetical protein